MTNVNVAHVFEPSECVMCGEDDATMTIMYGDMEGERICGFCNGHECMVCDGAGAGWEDAWDHGYHTHGKMVYGECSRCGGKGVMRGI